MEVICREQLADVLKALATELLHTMTQSSYIEHDDSIYSKNAVEAAQVPLQLNTVRPVWLTGPWLRNQGSLIALRLTFEIERC